MTAKHRSLIFSGSTRVVMVFWLACGVAQTARSQEATATPPACIDSIINGTTCVRAPYLVRFTTDANGTITGGTIEVHVNVNCSGVLQYDVGASLTGGQVEVDGTTTQTNNSVHVQYPPPSGTPVPAPLPGGGYGPVSGNHTFVFHIDANAARQAMCNHLDSSTNQWIGPWTITNVTSQFGRGFTGSQGHSFVVSGGPPISLVVNSEADTDDKDPTDGKCDTGKTISNGQAECTLRAAITEANHQGGGNITFSGVGKTTPQKALPEITAPITIDGTTAQGGRFELSGQFPPEHDNFGNATNRFNGLTITAGNSTVEGLIINQFVGYGVVLRSRGNNTIEGCFLGTDRSGLTTLGNGYLVSDNNGIRNERGGILIDNSPGNQIGGLAQNGTAPGNVISGNYSLTGRLSSNPDFLNEDQEEDLVISGSGSTGNVVQGNLIGPGVGGAALSDPTGRDDTVTLRYGILIDSASGNTIGGVAPGAANDIGFAGVAIENGATTNVVQGNLIRRCAGPGVFLAASGNTIGGDTPNAGNQILNNFDGIDVGGRILFGDRKLNADGTIVTQNTIGNNTNMGVRIALANGVVIKGNKIFGNGSSFGNKDIGGVVIEDLSSNNLPPNLGNSILGNSISHQNFGLGIDLGANSGNVTLDDSVGHSGPNHNQNFPVFVNGVAAFGAQTVNGQTRFKGKVPGSPFKSGTQYRIEFFSSTSCNQSGYGEGETFIGATQVQADVSGDATIDFTSTTAIPPGQFFTATATDLGTGDTSEFSKCTLVQGSTDSDKDGISNAVEDGVPTRNNMATVIKGNSTAGAFATGDGNGDGIPDSQQANVASFPDNSGNYVTLASPTVTQLIKVEPSGVPIPGDTPSPSVTGAEKAATAMVTPPGNVTFTEGFFSYGVTSLPDSGAVTVTLFLPPGVTANTFWNYGPTPDNTAPHWYEFKYDGTTGAEMQADRVILHFVDGQRGDHDLTKNGAISTLGGPGLATALLLNISTRLPVTGGDHVLIAGFIVTGSDPKKVLVRGLGPSLPVTGALADPTLELHDATGAIVAANDNWKDTQAADIQATTIPPTNDLESAIVATLPANNASYTAILNGKNGGSGIGLVEVYDLTQSANSKLANISTRGFVDTGDNIMIGGLILGPDVTSRAKVLVRAIGPSLAFAGVQGALADPTLELHDANGGTVAANDNWKDTQELDIIETSIPPSNDLESAILQTLTPGNYTAIVRGKNSGTGVALVEVYNLQ